MLIYTSTPCILGSSQQQVLLCLSEKLELHAVTERGGQIWGPKGAITAARITLNRHIGTTDSVSWGALGEHKPLQRVQLLYKYTHLNFLAVQAVGMVNFYTVSFSDQKCCASLFLIALNGFDTNTPGQKKKKKRSGVSLECQKTPH